MNKEERMKEIAKASPNFGKRVGYKMCVVDELHDMKELEAQNKWLEGCKLELAEHLGKANDRIVDLEEKISVLLSCKNCPDNKGGYICKKEYEDKCLAQKIQYIKELQEENKKLKRQVEQKQHLADVRLEQSLESYKLFSDERKARIDVDIALDDTTDQLTYAKTIIQDLLDNTDEYARQKAEDFLKENK